MKKFYSFIAVALMLVSATAVVSCGSDKNDPVTEEENDDVAVVPGWSSSCTVVVFSADGTSSQSSVPNAVCSAVVKLIQSKIGDLGEVNFTSSLSTTNLASQLAVTFSARPSNVSALRTAVSQISQSDLLAAVNAVSDWTSVSFTVEDNDGTILKFRESKSALTTTPTGTWASADGKYVLTITDKVISDGSWGVSNEATLTIDGTQHPGQTVNTFVNFSIRFVTDEQVGSFNLYLMSCSFPAKDKTDTFVAELMKGGSSIYENVFEDVTFTKQK